MDQQLLEIFLELTSNAQWMAIVQATQYYILPEPLNRFNFSKFFPIKTNPPK